MMLKASLLLLSLIATASCASLPDGPGECIFGFNVIAQKPLPLAVGDSTNVTAQRVPNCGGKLPVTWSVEAPALARVRSTSDSTAVVTGLSAGTTSVSANNGGKSGFLVLTVK